MLDLQFSFHRTGGDSRWEFRLDSGKGYSGDRAPGLDLKGSLIGLPFSLLPNHLHKGVSQ